MVFDELELEEAIATARPSAATGSELVLPAARADRPGRKVVLIGTYPPTACGLATFTANLRAAIECPEEGWVADVVRLVDRPAGTGGEVVDEWVAGDLSTLSRCLGTMARYDVVVLQHEYGLFGGPDGEEVLSLAYALEVPLVAVLHTVLLQPSAHERKILDHVMKAAMTVVVQSHAAKDRLVAVHGADGSKISVVPHGAAANFAPYLPPTGTPRVLTWRLLGPGKGIEHAIRSDLGRTARRSRWCPMGQRQTSPPTYPPPAPPASSPRACSGRARASSMPSGPIWGGRLEDLGGAPWGSGKLRPLPTPHRHPPRPHLGPARAGQGHRACHPGGSLPAPPGPGSGLRGGRPDPPQGPSRLRGELPQQPPGPGRPPGSGRPGELRRRLPGLGGPAGLGALGGRGPAALRLDRPGEQRGAGGGGRLGQAGGRDPLPPRPGAVVARCGHHRAPP